MSIVGQPPERIDSFTFCTYQFHNGDNEFGALFFTKQQARLCLSTGRVRLMGTFDFIVCEKKIAIVGAGACGDVLLWPRGDDLEAQATTFAGSKWHFRNVTPQNLIDEGAPQSNWWDTELAQRAADLQIDD